MIEVPDADGSMETNAVAGTGGSDTGRITERYIIAHSFITHHLHAAQSICCHAHLRLRRPPVGVVHLTDVLNLSRS